MKQNNSNLKEYLGINDKTEKQIKEIIMSYAPIIIDVFNYNIINPNIPWPHAFIEFTNKNEENAYTREALLDITLEMLKVELDTKVNDNTLLGIVRDVFYKTALEKANIKIDLVDPEKTVENSFVTEEEIGEARIRR